MSEFDDLMRQKAVALKYNPEKNGAPVIVASGMGYLAEKINECRANFHDCHRQRFYFYDYKII